MGLTLKRFGFALLLLAAALLPLRTPGTLEPRDTRSERWQRLDSLSLQMRQSQAAWAAFALRDSGTRMIAMMPATTPTPTVVLRGFDRGVGAGAIDSVARDLWQRVDTPHPGVRVGVFVYNSELFAHGGYVGTYIAPADRGVDCIGITYSWLDRQNKINASSGYLTYPLGPCALLAEFGAPGTGVSQWLDATDHALATSGDWLLPRKDTTTFYMPWSMWGYELLGPSVPQSSFGWLANLGISEYSTTIPPYYFGSMGVRCLAGDEDACATTVLHPALKAPADSAFPRGFTGGRWFPTRPEIVSMATVRPPSSTLVSSMIVEFGREKFQKFWASNEPFEVAFQQAFGTSLGAWTHHWATDLWHHRFISLRPGEHVTGEVRDGDVVRLGVTTRAASVPIAFLWTAIWLLVAAGVAKRRTA